ncbi:hypothetical protein TARUN_6675 [Trichoderma arundinaceum]|uniref:Uncharacterized protein n=1 Tax=Trichoderma arundinaceum TaxID=490622 RepID=A0A395NHQ0_TRIAR|nr:hypothetical protein TARUN_6675 [Trichoderma arundinaceum]
MPPLHPHSTMKCWPVAVDKMDSGSVAAAAARPESCKAFSSCSCLRLSLNRALIVLCVARSHRKLGCKPGYATKAGCPTALSPFAACLWPAAKRAFGQNVPLPQRGALRRPSRRPYRAATNRLCAEILPQAASSRKHRGLAERARCRRGDARPGSPQALCCAARSRWQSTRRHASRPIPRQPTATDRENKAGGAGPEGVRVSRRALFAVRTSCSLLVPGCLHCIDDYSQSGVARARAHPGMEYLRLYHRDPALSLRLLLGACGSLLCCAVLLWLPPPIFLGAISLKSVSRGGGSGAVSRAMGDTVLCMQRGTVAALQAPRSVAEDQCGWL